MEESFHHQLMKTYYAVHKCVVSKTQKIGLTSGQPKILEMLLEHDGVEQVTIAENCKIEPATVGNLLGRMEDNGLVERKRKENNRRSLFVYLTDKGRAAAENTERIFEEVEHQAFSGMDEDKKEFICQCLKQIYNNLESNVKRRV